jgi:uncharacterized phage-associated protein
MYNSFDIAKAFVSFAKSENKGVDTMKLLKLTYIAHGYYLGFFGKPLFESQVEAWKYGPVIPELYHVIKRFGTGNVDKELLDLYAEHPISEKDLKFLKAVWNFYKNHTGLALSSKTHEKDTPWDKTYTSSRSRKVIENALIETYYKHLINVKGEHVGQN